MNIYGSAQSKRQLCEEASINGHVQYVGYCTNHWQKRVCIKFCIFSFCIVFKTKQDTLIAKYSMFT